jgi:hypothetical protein
MTEANAQIATLFKTLSIAYQLSGPQSTVIRHHPKSIAIVSVTPPAITRSKEPFIVALKQALKKSKQARNNDKKG